MICIYMIQHKESKKAYIGQTTNYNRRMIRHRADSKHVEQNYLIHRAINKYGVDAFDFVVLEECCKDDLNEREMYWISHYDSYHNGYNMNGGGASFGKGEGSTSSRITELTARRILSIKKNSAAPLKEVADYFNCTLATVSNIGINSWSYLEECSDQIVQMFCTKYPIDADNILVFDKDTFELIGEYESSKHVVDAGILNTNVKTVQQSVAVATKKKICFDNKVFVRKKDYTDELIKNIAQKAQNRVQWIDVYYKDGKYLKRFTSRKEIKDELGLTSSQISNGLHVKNQVVTKGYILITDVMCRNNITIDSQLERIASFRDKN
ncbi:GIY-YIG endonuclease [Bacillus phage vB_BauM_KLEB27-3]|nr:GIY-YIG endonuclease [Bacillus phage vB_BauM_KLEB27-3]